MYAEVGRGQDFKEETIHFFELESERLQQAPDIVIDHRKKRDDTVL